MKIAFLLYPTSKININEDSSFWIMWELKKRGHQVYYFLSENILASSKGLYARLSKAILSEKKGYLHSPAASKPVNLADLECIFIRKEPIFDTQYLYSLQLLNLIRDRVFILNDPRGIALANEKTFCLRFQGLIPETLVTQNISDGAKFIRSLKSKAVIKPLDDKGGAGIFLTSPANQDLLKTLETATLAGRKSVMIQRYLDVSRHGDKRIVILNGRILGAFLRKPPPHDFRANLSVGATMHRTTVSPKEHHLVQAIAAELVKNGLWFVGIDVIGNYLTEINVTSPAGIPEIKHFEKTFPEKKVADFIESRVKRN